MEQKFEKMENGRLSAPTIISILIFICSTDVIWRDITMLNLPTLVLSLFVRT